jgi:hypothetical protein
MPTYPVTRLICGFIIGAMDFLAFLKFSLPVTEAHEFI